MTHLEALRMLHLDTSSTPEERLLAYQRALDDLARLQGLAESPEMRNGYAHAHQQGAERLNEAWQLLQALSQPDPSQPRVAETSAVVAGQGRIADAIPDEFRNVRLVRPSPTRLVLGPNPRAYLNVLLILLLSVAFLLGSSVFLFIPAWTPPSMITMRADGFWTIAAVVTLIASAVGVWHGIYRSRNLRSITFDRASATLRYRSGRRKCSIPLSHLTAVECAPGQGFDYVETRVNPGGGAIHKAVMRRKETFALRIRVRDLAMAAGATEYHVNLSDHTDEQWTHEAAKQIRAYLELT